VGVYFLVSNAGFVCTLGSFARLPPFATLPISGFIGTLAGVCTLGSFGGLPISGSTGTLARTLSNSIFFK